METNTDEPWLDEMREEFWFPFLDMLPEESEFDIELSGKFLVLKYILDKCTDIGDKVLLFSRSIYTLNHIERFLHHVQSENEKNENPIEWIRDRDYFRMDGQTDVTARKRYTKTFNDLSNTRARLFLISTLAGGIGINLVGSNRVIIFDASWNPSHDTQAIFRSYRFGQKKPVYIYRLLAQGTMEEKIYQRQVVKQSLSQRFEDRKTSFFRKYDCVCFLGLLMIINWIVILLKMTLKNCINLILNSYRMLKQHQHH